MWDKLFKNSNFILLIFGLTTLQLALSYYGQVVHQYPVAPGDDIFNHLRAMENLQQNPVLWQWGGYPIGFRILVVWLSNIFAAGELITTLKFVWPLLPVLSSLAIFLLATKLFSKKIGLLTFIIYGFLSLQPLQTLYDGGLPNVFAGNTVLPLTLLLWVTVWQNLQQGYRRLVWPVLGLLTGIFVILYSHHLSSIVLIVNLLVTFPFLAFWSTRKLVGQKRWQIPIGLIITGLVLTFLLAQAPIFNNLKDLLETVRNYALPSPPWQWSRYHTSINGLLFQGSIAGILVLFWRRLRRPSLLTAGEIMLTVWFIIYLVGSRLSAVAEPERLARDLAMPGAILAGYFIYYAYHYLKNKGEMVAATLFSIFIIGSFVLATAVKTAELTQYNQLIRFSAADAQLLQQVQNSKSIIALNSHTPAWNYLAPEEVSSRKIRLINSTKQADYYIGLGRCVYLEIYKNFIWPENYRKNQIYEELKQSNLEINIQPRYEDSLKLWYEVCAR